MGHGPDSCPVTLPYQAHRLVLWLQRRVPSGKPTTRCPYPLFFIFTAFGSCSFSCSFFSSHAPNSHPLFLLIWLFPTSNLLFLLPTASPPLPLLRRLVGQLHHHIFSSIWLLILPSSHRADWYASISCVDTPVCTWTETETLPHTKQKRKYFIIQNLIYTIM